MSTDKALSGHQKIVDLTQACCARNEEGSALDLQPRLSMQPQNVSQPTPNRAAGLSASMKALSVGNKPAEEERPNLKRSMESSEEEDGRRKSNRTESLLSVGNFENSPFSNGLRHASKSSLSVLNGKDEHSDNDQMVTDDKRFGDESACKESDGNGMRAVYESHAALSEGGGDPSARCDGAMLPPKRKGIARVIPNIVCTISHDQQVNKHHRYQAVQDDIKDERDKYIRKIERYGAPTGEWLPLALRPHNLPGHPRDWSTSLLQWIKKLAKITQGDMERAHGSLRDVTRGGPVGWEDVRKAHERCSHANGYDEGRGERLQATNAADRSPPISEAQKTANEGGKKQQEKKGHSKADKDKGKQRTTKDTSCTPNWMKKGFGNDFDEDDEEPEQAFVKQEDVEDDVKPHHQGMEGITPARSQPTQPQLYPWNGPSSTQGFPPSSSNTPPFHPPPPPLHYTAYSPQQRSPLQAAAPQGPHAAVAGPSWLPQQQSSGHQNNGRGMGSRLSFDGRVEVVERQRKFTSFGKGGFYSGAW